MVISINSFKSQNFRKNFIKTSIGYLLCMLVMWLVYHNDPIVSPLAYYVYSSVFYFLLAYVVRKLYPFIKKDSFTLYFILASLAAIVIALSPVMFHLGWPLNHDHLLWKLHTRTWAAHISQFDLIPLWSSRDGAGMGVPIPLYYHKLFYVVSSSFYILSGKIKASIILSLMSFMLAGIVGVYKVALCLGNKRWIALMASLAFVFLNYSMSNWYLRGAMAEFSAMMIVPYLFYEELKLIKTKQYSHWLGVFIFLLGFSHSVIGYYSIFTVLATLIILFFSVRWQQAFKILKGLAISAIAIIAVYMVYIIPMLILSDDFNPSKIKENGALPQHSIVNFVRYLYDYQYEWFSKPFYGFSVQMDLPVLGIILLALIVFLAKLKTIQSGVHRITAFKVKAIVLILLLDAFFIFLQTKASVSFYENVPGAEFVQFPWRLLSFIQVLNLMVLLWLLSNLEALNNKKLSYTIAGALLAMTIAFYPAFQKTDYRWYRNAQVESMIRRKCNVGEYLPTISGTRVKLLSEQMYLLADRGVEIKEEGNFLRLRNKLELYSEALNASFYADIKNPTVVILPITYTELTRMFRIDLETGEETQLAIYRTAKDPRIRAFLSDGEYDLRVDLPTLKNLFIPKLNRREEERIELVECNVEMLSNSKKNFISNDKRYFITGAKYRNDEKARSGKYSVKLFDKQEFGLGFQINSNEVYGEELRVGVWRHGSPRAGLVIEAAGKVIVRQNVAAESDSLGWEKLVVNLKLPPEVGRDELIKIYVHRPASAQETYFDDFFFETINKENPIWYTSQKGIGHKSFKDVVFDINNSEAWLEKIRVQAEERNISLDSNIRRNAKYVVQLQANAKERK